MLEIFVDADGCPVKEEVYRVADRYGLPVTLVANAWMRTPLRPEVRLVVVREGMDQADDWIVEKAGRGDVVVTSDIPLAARCLEKGARALSPKGRVFDQDSIGEAVAGRALSAHLREMGVITGGPAPMDKRSRSLFLQRLDDLVQAARREEAPGGS